MPYNQTKQDRMQIFEEILKATNNAKTNKNSLIFYRLDSCEDILKATYNAKINKQFTCLLPVAFLPKAESTREFVLRRLVL